MAITNLSDQLAINPQALDKVRSQAKSASTKDGVKAVARQFETYFLQLILRNLRETLPQDGLFDSQETKSFTEIFDKQISQTIAQGKGIGLADVLLAQIERSLPKTPGETAPIINRPVNYDLPKVDRQISENGVAAISSLELQKTETPGTTGNFIQQIWPHAVDAAKKLGVSPQSLAAQAALESGWGKRELKNADGSSTYNLFNIKASTGWIGQTVTREVLEYKNGVAGKQLERFKAYSSYEEAFSDYAKLISGSPRYSGALNQDINGFATGLQQGGFATDPGYANKVIRVFNSPAFREVLPGDAVQSTVG